MAPRSKSRPKTRTPAPKKRRFTAPELQNIRHLAEQLGEILPLSGFRSTFSLKVIAKERGLAHLLPETGNKKEVFAEFIANVLREKPRTLKMLVRELLPRAIERRHDQGNPVLAAEAAELDRRLQAVGVDLAEEIKDLHLPAERPVIVPPPPEIQKALKSVGLHPLLLPDCQTLFIDGHINEAVRKAHEKLETSVQQLALATDKQGAELIGLAFGGAAPRVKLNACSTLTERNEQEGFCLLAMGAMKWWRNELSHGDTAQLPHQEALGRLLLVSNLLHRLGRVTP